MKQNLKVFVTDCEGPISKNDNAFELTSRFVPNGDRFFTLISRYDDVLSDIVKKPGYKAGDTLRLILPFLKAYGATNGAMKEYSSQNILLVPGAGETLNFVRRIMPSFIVSTSYEHYIHALCDAVGFPKENVYCTRLNMDKYELDKEEIEKLKSLCEEILSMPIIEIPDSANSLSDLPLESRNTVNRLNEIFWKEIPLMKADKMLKDVNPVGGYEKANAIRDIAEKTGVDISNIIYVGDSITDVEPFQLVRKKGGVTVSFNGNRYAVREAEIAVMSPHTIVTSILAEVFCKLGKDSLMRLAENWSLLNVRNVCSFQLFKKLETLYLQNKPRVERVTPHNMERLTRESSAFRKTVRGEAVGRLG